jgi:hypothetical protein
MHVSELRMPVRLWIGFGTVVGMLVWAGGIGATSAIHRQRLTNALRLDCKTKSLTALIQSSFLEERASIRNALLNDETGYPADAESEADRHSAELELLLGTDTGRRLFAKIQETHAQYRQAFDQAFSSCATLALDHWQTMRQICFTGSGRIAAGALSVVVSPLPDFSERIVSDRKTHCTTLGASNVVFDSHNGRRQS